ncbi:winged helix-turn-helix transcriptional regulator [Roseateles sp.]
MAEGRLSRREMAARLGLSERTFYRRLKALGAPGEG